MTILCKAGQRGGIKCDHKRNMGDGVVLCGLNADKERCCFAESEEEFNTKIQEKLKKVK